MTGFDGFVTWVLEALWGVLYHVVFLGPGQLFLRGVLGRRRDEVSEPLTALAALLFWGVVLTLAHATA